MIAVDTNILVYAHRKDSPWHAAAARLVAELAESTAPWAIPWPCIHEFLAIATHPRIYLPPTPMARAVGQVAIWRESPSLVLLGESGSYWDVLSPMLTAGHVAGPRVHDARVAAICRDHDIAELWTADRDFGRFAEVPTRNPLLG